jgi:hypothetical protein
MLLQYIEKAARSSVLLPDEQPTLPSLLLERRIL